MIAANINEGAGDLPEIPMRPIESFHQEETLQVSHHDDRSRPITALFNFHEIIGKGGFSKVKRATLKATGDTFAVKILDKSKIEERMFPRVILEIETLASLSHPHICKLYSAFYTSSKIYMVMEYCYTDLFEYLVKLQKPMAEAKGRRVFMQLLSAVSYLHYMGIAHRDIKPENILLARKMKVKLGDFGFSSKFPQTRHHLLSTYCGSLAYSAPEVVFGQPYCGMKADMWSLGVNLYVILTNRQPFKSRNPNELRAQISSGSFQVHRHLSKHGHHLIRRLLTVAPDKRPTIQDIWKDSWIKEDPHYLASLSNQCGGALTVRTACSLEKWPVSSSSLVWFHQPACRSEPVQQEESSTRRRIQSVLDFTRMKFLKFRNSLFLRKT